MNVTVPSVATLEAIIRSAGVRTVRIEPRRRFLAESPELAAAARDVEPWLGPALDTLLRELPLPKTVTSFIERPFYRPPGSYRCFYYCPSTLARPGDDPGRAVLAIKGLEPAAPDVDALFSDLKRACYSPHNIAEHLVLEERKIPGCVSLQEAIREAERARAIQSAHSSAYGGLARVPLPLFVYRHPEPVVARMIDHLRELLSKAAFEIVEPLAAEGLGVYVYYYPAPPVRARDLDYVLQGMRFGERVTLLSEMCDPDKVIGRWISLCVRMLYLGVLPGSLSSLRTGICCQPQNACIDGGFVDLDSLTPLSELRDDTAVQAALQLSTESLLRTVGTLVTGGSDPTRPESHEVRVGSHYLWQHLWTRIEAAIESEARPGLELDPRVREYFTPARSFTDLVDRLRTYYSPPSPSFDDASRRFGELGPWLVLAAKDS